MRQNIQMRKVCYKVSEGLYNKAIKEGVTLEDLEKDIKIIMDALGLSEEEEKENESKTEELDINVDNNSDDFAIEDKTEEFVDNDEENVEDTETKESINESFHIKNNHKYMIEFSNNALGKEWYRQISSFVGREEQTSEKTIYFDSIDELIKFIATKLPVRYNDVDQIYYNDENNTSGRIFSSMYFTIYKGE